jgi:hypothetical protein
MLENSTGSATRDHDVLWVVRLLSEELRER